MGRLACWKVERPVTFFTGGFLVAALICAHVLYDRLVPLLVADALVAAFAIYNTLLPDPVKEPVPEEVRRTSRRKD